MLGAIVLCIFLAVVCSLLAWKRVKFCQMVGHIPGPLAFPIVGNALQFERESHGKKVVQANNVVQDNKMFDIYVFRTIYA